MLVSLSEASTVFPQYHKSTHALTISTTISLVRTSQCRLQRGEQQQQQQQAQTQLSGELTDAGEENNSPRSPDTAAVAAAPQEAAVGGDRGQRMAAALATMPQVCCASGAVMQQCLVLW